MTHARVKEVWGLATLILLGLCLWTLLEIRDEFHAQHRLPPLNPTEIAGTTVATPGQNGRLAYRTTPDAVRNPPWPEVTSFTQAWQKAITSGYHIVVFVIALVLFDSAVVRMGQAEDQLIPA